MPVTRYQGVAPKRNRRRHQCKNAQERARQKPDHPRITLIALKR
jgi:hypothetical protein